MTTEELFALAFAEAKALLLEYKASQWVDGYTRADGTHVDGYWRFTGRIGATPFRPEDIAEGFFDSPKAKAFEKRLPELAQQHGVILDKVERVMGYWEGDLEPSWAIEAHDGEIGVYNLSKQIQNEENQDAVLNFDYDAKDGDDIMYVLRGDVDWVNALKDAGVQGATIHKDRVEIIGDDAMADQIEKLRDATKSDVTAVRGWFHLVERV